MTRSYNRVKRVPSNFPVTIMIPLFQVVEVAVVAEAVEVI
jgi:hypothetical protein